MFAHDPESGRSIGYRIKRCLSNSFERLAVSEVIGIHDLAADRLTVNQCFMHFRKRSVKLERTTEEGEAPVQIVRGTENPNAMPVMDRIALDNALKQLPPGYRTVFVLHDVDRS